ncbi:hypothetical protein [Streptomyces fumanus]|uniref:Uncharacterized protein n=1 Tax=Streptomyces fumanus TaxID=67302 RepID=A0A919AEF6_9ACTN|nr:hypothetical protein [Streptomyces fumanus]GHF01741.1 hypothetical protein GCM10018772_28330 [Streptomyces fumanus]
MLIGIGLLVVLGALAWAARHRTRYPGAWGHAFGRRHRDRRRALAAAREGVRAWARRVEQDESWAQRELAGAEAGRKERLAGAERHLAALRAPGRGERLDALGELTLFRHRLVIRTSTGTRTIGLADLEVRFEPGRLNHSVYCTDATGRVHRAKYPHSPPATDPSEPRYDEDRVRDFAVTVQNAIAEERLFRDRLPEELERAEAELAKLRADTGAVDTARERLTRLRELNRQDPRRAAARAALEEAREDWRKLTGRLPPE